MHLVFVSSLVPVKNPLSGFDIANRTLLDGLRALGHRVSVVGYLQPGQEPAPDCEIHLLGNLEVANARVDALTKLRWVATALASRTTLSSAKMLKTGKRTVERLLTRLEPFDGVILNSVQLPGAFLPVFRKYPAIYVAHNVEANSARENAAAASGAIERFLFSREARLLERIETQLTQAAFAVFTFAEADRFGFGPAVCEKAAVLPLVTRWDQPAGTISKDWTYDLALIGTWSWKPNRIGLDWFLSEVVPHLPQTMSIAIAGQLPDRPAVSHPGVSFLGRVPDARAFVQSGAVVPLISRGGTGVQLKTIETFEFGMPSVATSASLRGIADIPANCALADYAEDFARQLTEKVTQVRARVLPGVAGATFHQAQKSRLLAALSQGLSSLAKPAALREQTAANSRTALLSMGAPSLAFAASGEGKSR